MYGCDGAFQIPEETRPPGWVELGLEFSLAEDPVYPKDKAVTAAVQALDPTFVPLMVRWVFLAPADAQTSERERHVFRFHGIGRTTFTLNTEGVAPAEVDDGFDLLKIKNLEIPPGYTGKIPLYLDPTVGILDDPRYIGLEPRFQSAAQQHGASDLPGTFIPWDWALVTALKRCYSKDHTVKELQQSQIITPMQARKEARRQSVADFTHNFRDFQKWAHEKIQAASVDEHKAQAAKRAMLTQVQYEARMAKALSFKIHGVN